MNTSLRAFGFNAAALRPTRGFKTAATKAVVKAVVVAGCSMAFNAGLASGHEPLVDVHDFLNDPATTGRESVSEELHKIFWMCDFAATMDDLDAGQKEQCRAVTAHVERVRFKGNSELFIAWRRNNRAMAHAQLGAGSSELSCQQASSQTEARS